jgi:hypothetical protein
MNFYIRCTFKCTFRYAVAQSCSKSMKVVQSCLKNAVALSCLRNAVAQSCIKNAVAQSCFAEKRCKRSKNCIKNSWDSVKRDSGKWDSGKHDSGKWDSGKRNSENIPNPLYIVEVFFTDLPHEMRNLYFRFFERILFCFIYDLEFSLCFSSK